MLSSKVFIVTGANTGIGKEIARGIAKQGHNVVLACRDETKAKTAIEDLGKSFRISTITNCSIFGNSKRKPSRNAS